MLFYANICYCRLIYVIVNYNSMLVPSCTKKTETFYSVIKRFACVPLSLNSL